MVWHHRVIIAADDGFQRQFDRQVKVVAEKRLGSLYRLAAVQLEGISDVVIADAEQKFNNGRAKRMYFNWGSTAPAMLPILVPPQV